MNKPGLKDCCTVCAFADLAEDTQVDTPQTPLPRPPSRISQPDRVCNEGSVVQPATTANKTQDIPVVQKIVEQSDVDRFDLWKDSFISVQPSQSRILGQKQGRGNTVDNLSSPAFKRSAAREQGHDDGEGECLLLLDRLAGCFCLFIEIKFRDST